MCNFVHREKILASTTPLTTNDWEAIEGEALDGVIVHGLLTYTITRLYDDDGVV